MLISRRARDREERTHTRTDKDRDTSPQRCDTTHHLPFLPSRLTHTHKVTREEKGACKPDAGGGALRRLAVGRLNHLDTGGAALHWTPIARLASHNPVLGRINLRENSLFKFIYNCFSIYRATLAATICRSRAEKSNARNLGPMGSISSSLSSTAVHHSVGPLCYSCISVCQMVTNLW